MYFLVTYRNCLFKNIKVIPGSSSVQALEICNCNFEAKPTGIFIQFPLHLVEISIYRCSCIVLAPLPLPLPSATIKQHSNVIGCFLLLLLLMLYCLGPLTCMYLSVFYKLLWFQGYFKVIWIFNL